MKKESKKEILLCSCHSTEHQLLFLWFDDDEHKEVYLHIHLVKRNSFFKRLVYGIKYIFGYKCKFGAFDEIVLNDLHVDQLEKVVKFLKK